jgi:hypothetical protein
MSTLANAALQLAGLAANSSGVTPSCSKAWNARWSSGCLNFAFSKSAAHPNQLSIIINYYQLLSIIINYYQLLSIIINYYQLLSIIINYYQLSIINCYVSK